MDLREIKYLENISKAAPFENYFFCYPNKPYTSIELKQLRVLAFLLKKLIMIPHFHRLCYKIFSYIFKSYNHRRYKVERDIVEVKSNEANKQKIEREKNTNKKKNLILFLILKIILLFCIA